MRKFVLFILAALMSFLQVSAESATSELNFVLPSYVNIQSVLSPVLIANITNRNGDLQVPLCSKFKVITNSAETKTLYLKAKTNTEAGQENAFFEQGGQVYVAFANLAKVPTSQALMNCKIGSSSKDSPGVVAYPVISVTGTENKFNHDKYEVYTPNGTSYVTVNVGTNVLKNSFASNDPKGFYQAVLSLTEADI